MKVSLWAEIRRLHEIEQLNCSEIAVKLNRSRYLVTRALGTSQPPINKPSAPRTKLLDPFRERIAKILDRVPNR
ncbi:MAG: hypothetical protein ABL921_32945 [Pirellula sp.]